MIAYLSLIYDFDEKVGEIPEKLTKLGKKSGKNKIVLTNIAKNVDIAHFISINCQRIRIISVTFCYLADKLESGKNI